MQSLGLGMTISASSVGCCTAQRERRSAGTVSSTTTRRCSWPRSTTAGCSTLVIAVRRVAYVTLRWCTTSRCSASTGRTLDWGVILRKYPDGFQIYNQVGPECVVTMWRRGMRSVVNRLLRFHSFISGRAAQVRADRDAQQHAIGRQARRDIFIRLSGGGD